MKIEIEDGVAVVKADDGAAIFQIDLTEGGEPAVNIRAVSSGFVMRGVRYAGALDIKPQASNSVQCVASRHPSQSFAGKLPERE